MAFSDPKKAREYQRAYQRSPKYRARENARRQEDSPVQEERKKKDRERKAQVYADPEQRQKVLWRQRLKRYGLIPERYEELLQAQDGRCAICRQTPETFMIDHDHKTGRVRGLLCPGCNLGLGHFKDDPDRLLAAKEYLVSAKEG